MAETQKKKKSLLDDNKIALFNEAEVCQDPKAQEPTEETFTTKRKVKSEDPVPQKLPIREFVLEIPDEQCLCNRCGAKLTLDEKKFVRSELIMLPQIQKRLEYYVCTYVCKRCEQNDDFVCRETRVAPKPLMKHSLASPATVADVMVKKYMQSESLAKQEKTWSKLGITLSRATMANWIVQCAQTWLKPLYRHMKQQLLEEKVICADMTAAAVLDKEAAPVNTDGRMWLYTSSPYSTKQICVFEYQPKGSGKCPEVFLKGFSGCLFTDHASEAFQQVTKATHCLGWKTACQKWADAIPDGIAPSKAGYPGQCYKFCKTLGSLGQYAYVDSAKRKAHRQNKVWTPVEKYFLWLKALQAYADKDQGMEEAIRYSLDHKQQLTAFLEYADVPIINELAESAIAPFQGKKRWHLCDGNKGAESSAIVYSLLLTAQANKVDPYDYLLQILSLLPYYEIKSMSHDQLEQFMPWHPDVKNAAD